MDTATRVVSRWRERGAVMADLSVSIWMPFVMAPLWFGILLLHWSRLACPECGTGAPLLISPFAKTRRQWAEGGWTCATCGTDVDVRGWKVAPGTGPRPGWL